MEFELLDNNEFFAPMSSDLVDMLVAEFNASKTKIIQLSENVTTNHLNVLRYFIDGNVKEDGYRIDIPKLFDLTNAIKSLESEYWNKALNLTDVLNYMPQKRRNDWSESLSGWKKYGYKEGKEPEKDLPPFEETIVRDTLQNMLHMRTQFFSERVDGIFKGLSGEHITNQPQGFGKRMIVNHVITDYGTVEYKKSGIINDLRSVIAKFMGRGDLHYSSTDMMIKSLKERYGEWVSIDGGSLKLKLFKKGTVHIEVHPDMAWRLNSILANLYPMAIPAQFRVKPERKTKTFDLIQKPLPFKVIEILSSCGKAKSYANNKVTEIDNTINFNAKDKTIIAEVESVLESIGGVKNNKGYFDFDYAPYSIINEIIITGCIPNYKSFQFYPTPEELSNKVFELADINDTHSILEPSAGQGNLLKQLDYKDNVTCIEVSTLHCSILTEKGFNVINDDFLKYAKDTTTLFDRIIMNPPFSEGRWTAHLEAAYSKLKPNGRLVAILPASAKSQKIIPNVEYHGPFDNYFTNASVSVIILVAQK